MDIKCLKGVGPKLAENLRTIGISSVKDALLYFPRDYEDRNNIKPIDEIRDGENVAIKCEVEIIPPVRRNYSRKTVNRIVFKCSSGYVVGIWFNKPYISNNFKVGDKVFLYGKASKKLGEVQIIEPEYEKNFGNIIYGINPIYSLNKYNSQKVLRKIIMQSIEHIDGEVTEILPEEIRKIFSLPDIKTAICNIHFPQSNEILNLSRRRIKFEELFILQLGLFLAKKNFIKSKISLSVPVNEKIKTVKEMLPFKLTAAQSRTIREILEDMKKDTPMNRLVQGDVGSGKTIVAFIAILNCAFNGYQSAMMAPTEILAEQHFNAIKAFSDRLGLKAALIKGNIPQKERKILLEQISNGEIDIAIGTHALIQEDVQFKNLALVVTDEQHRFGVRQRADLIGKGNNPHVLVMTATPIPRTLAIFIYGDMDISIIDELPPGRKKIDTYFVDSGKKERAYNFIKKQIEIGRQAYVVCPMIEESEKIEVESAVETYQSIKEKYFSKYSVGLLHGKMTSREKDEIMTKFKEGRIDVLVSTTVIEVGVNVPNASIMLIENSDRFGLAQLHQLRGRVGRGEFQSHCILISDVKSKICLERMKIMTQTNDGFKIADKDLELRGTGEFFGIRQHGLPELKVADIVRDIELVKQTRDIANEIINTGKINDSSYEALRREVNLLFYEKIRDATFN